MEVNMAKKICATLLTVFLVLTMTAVSPKVSSAGGIDTIAFVNTTNSYFFVGAAHMGYNNIAFNMFNGGNAVTGSLYATVTNPDGTSSVCQVEGTTNTYYLSNVSLGDPGIYTLTVYDSQGNMATGYLLADVSGVQAKAYVTGSLVMNTASTVTVKLTDNQNNALPKASLTVDGTAVQATPATQTLTTLNDGTATFSMTPTKSGLVNLIYNGNIIGVIAVNSSAGVVVTTTGNLVFNSNSLMTVKLVDASGNPLQKVSVTIDGTNVGASPATQTLTTRNDGTADFAITPTLYGTVSIIYNGDVVGTLQVSPGAVKATVTGPLVINNNNFVTVKLTDNSGNPLQRKSVTVDGTAAGAAPATQTLTTMNDGTFILQMTPTQTGTVNIIYGGDVVGTINAVSAYQTGSRIGSQTTGNASLSVAVAQQGWSKAANVILTRDDILADAMASVPLSKKLDAPILMTPSASLDNSVLHEITSLGAQTVYMIGGTGAVSPDIEQLLENSYHLSVVRLAGVDRYDTAAQIAQRVGSTGTVYLAYGFGEPDALAVSAFAAEQGNPILLTDTNQLPAVTQAELNALAPGSIKILGGTGVVSQSLENQLAGQYAVERWGGQDRYGTEYLIFQNLFHNQSPLYFASSLVESSDVASGNPYGDALLAGALAAKNNGFVVTLPPNSLPLPVANFLLYDKGYIPNATVIGNSRAINSNLDQQLQQILNH